MKWVGRTWAGNSSSWKKSTPWIPWTEARALLRVATGERTAQLAPMEFHLPALNKRYQRKLLEKNGGNAYVKYINLLLPCSHWLTLLSFLADHWTSSGIWLSFSCLPQLQLALLPEYLQRCQSQNLRVQLHDFTARLFSWNVSYDRFEW